MRERGLLCLCLLVCGGGVRADGKLEIKAKSVNYIPAGHAATIILYGENLTPNSVKADKPQVVVKLGVAKATEGDDKKKGSRQVVVEITPAANCPAENVELTLAQADGGKVTTQIAIVEDAAKEVVAKKPNTSYADAMPLTLTDGAGSLAVTGNVEGDNPATFRFEATAGETWRFGVFAGRGGSALDPVLRVRDSRHFSLALAAGDPKKDLVLTFTAPTTGTYYLELMDDQSRGGGTFTYRMTARSNTANRTRRTER